MRAIIIGAGPSLKEKSHLKMLVESDFQGPIITTDRMLKDCIEKGVTPERFSMFMCTFEDDHRCADYFTEPITEYGDKITCYTSVRTTPLIIEAIKKVNIRNLIRLEDEFIQDTSNVGLMCWYVAHHFLKCKTVGMIGMDHAADEKELLIKPNTDLWKFAYTEGYNPDFKCKYVMTPFFQGFRDDFLYYVKQFNGINTINCSEAGSLYGDNITCMKFGEFLNGY